MSSHDPLASQGGTVRVRYWAAARAASGVDHEMVPLDAPMSVADLIALTIGRRTGEADELARVLGVCSVLIGDRPTQDRSALVRPGETVEFLPPFAGG